MSDAALDQPLPVFKSLRAQGWAATLALLVYLLASVGYVTLERGRLDQSTQALERLGEHDKALALAEASVGNVLLDVNELSNAELAEPAAPNELRLYMESCTRLFSDLERFSPGYEHMHRNIVRSYEALQQAPVRASWLDLRENLQRVAAELDIRRRTLTDQRGQLTQSYQRQFDAVTVKSLALVAIGITLFGSLAAWFFARLCRDVQRLGEHAQQIVQGRRGVAMAVRRQDELGQLMHAVNRMALDLDEREKQIELEGQRRSHQDKMLAVGSLAAGVAHEVNNPLAVITGVAQSIKEAPGRVSPGELADSAQLIIVQAERAAHAARHLADVAAPQPAELDLMELNSLVRRVVQLLGYDRRYRAIVFELDTDSTLPAVRSSAMAVQQVLMQVLSMGCDAMGGRGSSAGVVQVATRRVDEGVEIELGFPPVLDFSRSEVQRSLLLARATIEPLGGRLAFPRKEGSLLQIRLVLPVGTAHEGA